MLGAYCLVSTSWPYEYECPPGTFNNKTGADDDYDCLPCTGWCNIISFNNYFELKYSILPPNNELVAQPFT